MSSDLQQLQVHILHVEQQLFGSENRELRKRTCYIIVFTRLVLESFFGRLVRLRASFAWRRQPSRREKQKHHE